MADPTREHDFRTLDPFGITAEIPLVEPVVDPLGPVEGISLETWAALDTALDSGDDFQDLMRGAGIEAVHWCHVANVWEQRLSRDKTWTVSSIHACAKRASGTGALASLAVEARAARLEARAPRVAMPLSVHAYYELLYAQAYAVASGEDVLGLLCSNGYTLVDWANLAVFAGYTMSCLSTTEQAEWRDIDAKVRATYRARFPRVRVYVDSAW